MLETLFNSEYCDVFRAPVLKSICQLTDNYCRLQLFSEFVLLKRGILPLLTKLSRYPNLETAFHIKLKFFLWTKLPESLLLAKYLISVAAILTFSWGELQMLLRCCLIHKTIIIPGHFFYWLYLRPCLDLGLFIHVASMWSIFHFGLYLYYD